MSESLRILDLEGNIVTQRKERPAWPRMTRSHPLMDSGVIVGSLEESASLRPLIVDSTVLAAAGTGITLLLFLLFRVYPISALRNALDMLSREKGRATVTLQSIGDGVISTDPEDRVLIINRMAERITGWTQAEAVGKPIDEVFQPEGDVLVDRSGVSHRIEAGKSPVLDEKGRRVGTVLVFRDVTEKARVEAAMANAQKLESLGVLAGGIAHEIRNPLSSINISISSIERACGASAGLEPEAKEKVDLILEQMKSAAAKMGLVVQRVMDYLQALSSPQGGRRPEQGHRGGDPALPVDVAETGDRGPQGPGSRPHDVPCRRPDDRAGAGQPDHERLPGDGRNREGETPGDRVRPFRTGGSSFVFPTRGREFPLPSGRGSSIPFSPRGRMGPGSGSASATGSSPTTAGRCASARADGEGRSSGSRSPSRRKEFRRDHVLPLYRRR